MAIDFFIHHNEFPRAYLGIEAVSFDLFETLVDLDKQRFTNMLKERLPNDKEWVKQLLSGNHGKPTIYNAIRLIMFGDELHYTNAIRRFIGDRFLTGRYGIEEVLDLSVSWVRELSLHLSAHSMEEAKEFIYLPQRDRSGQIFSEGALKEYHGYIAETARDWAKRFENYTPGADDKDSLGIILATLKECMVINQDALDFVRGLKSTGVKIGMISDTASCYLDIVDKLEMELGFRFDAKTYSCDTGRKKFYVRDIPGRQIKKNKPSSPGDLLMKKNNYVTLAAALFKIPQDSLTIGHMRSYLNIGNEYIEDALTLKRVKANGVLYASDEKLNILIEAFGKNIVQVPMVTFKGVLVDRDMIYMNAPKSF